MANFGRVLLMRIAGQSIIRDARKAAFANLMRQDMSFYDLQGDKPTLSAPATEVQDPSVSQKEKSTSTPNAEQSKSSSEDSTRVKSTGDIISRLSADASMVGDALTRYVSFL